MVDFDRMVQLRDRYVQEGNARREGNKTVNTRAVPADEWTPYIELCECGNMMDYFTLVRCYDCWMNILTRREKSV